MPTSSQPSLMAIMFVEVYRPSRIVMGPRNSLPKFAGRQSSPSGCGMMTALSSMTYEAGMPAEIAAVYTNGLKLEPAWRRARRARSNFDWA